MALRTIEAIIHPDGRIEALEAVATALPQRAIITILGEEVLSTLTTRSHRDRVRAALRTGGLLVEVPAHPSALALSEEDRAALARQYAAGTPLSQIVIEDREETF
jgi:ABC-type ATPase involved in cell division